MPDEESPLRGMVEGSLVWAWVKPKHLLMFTESETLPFQRTRTEAAGVPTGETSLSPMSLKTHRAIDNIYGEENTVKAKNRGYKVILVLSLNQERSSKTMFVQRLMVYLRPYSSFSSVFLSRTL